MAFLSSRIVHFRRDYDSAAAWCQSLGGDLLEEDNVELVGAPSSHSLLLTPSLDS